MRTFLQMTLRLLAPLPLVLAALVAAPIVSTAQGTDPGSVVTAFDTALNAGDVDATLALFADDAVVKAPRETYTGKEQLRGFFQQLVAGHVQWTSSNRQVVGDTETHAAKLSQDAWRKLGIDSVDATAQVVVRDGKIRSFTVTFTPESVARLQAAQTRAAQPGQAPSTGGGYGGRSDGAGATGAWLVLAVLAMLTVVGIATHRRRGRSERL